MLASVTNNTTIILWNTITKQEIQEKLDLWFSKGVDWPYLERIRRFNNMKEKNLELEARQLLYKSMWSFYHTEGYKDPNGTSFKTDYKHASYCYEKAAEAYTAWENTEKAKEMRMEAWNICITLWHKNKHYPVSAFDKERNGLDKVYLKSALAFYIWAGKNYEKAWAEDEEQEARKLAGNCNIMLCNYDEAAENRQRATLSAIEIADMFLEEDIDAEAERWYQKAGLTEKEKFLRMGDKHKKYRRSKAERWYKLAGLSKEEAKKKIDKY